MCNNAWVADEPEPQLNPEPQAMGTEPETSGTRHGGISLRGWRLRDLHHPLSPADELELAGGIRILYEG
jgi:hypothetical protein